MGRPKKKAKIKIKQNVQLVHRNDKTRVAKDTLQTYRQRQAPTQTRLPSNTATFKVKVRRKR